MVLSERRDAFFESEAWLRLRYQAIKANGGRCQACGERPSQDNPIQVDHIKARSRYPELALVLSNLQVLCKRCNHGKGAWDSTDWRAIYDISPELSQRPMPAREAIMLAVVMNHPWLLEHRAEELAAIEFEHENARSMLTVILDFAAGHQDDRITRSGLAAAIAGRGFEAIRKKIEAVAASHQHFPIKPSAAPADVHQWWIYACGTLRQFRSLKQELTEAENQLGCSTTNENYRRLQEARAAIDALDVDYLRRTGSPS